MTSLKNTIYLALFFAIAMSIFNTVYFDIRYALLSFPISFLVFGLPIFLFSRSKAVNIEPAIDTAGQAIIYSSPANHYSNGIGIGGKLYLMADKIQFQSYQVPILRHGHVLMIDQISTVKSYKILGVVPTALLITTLNGDRQKFVVTDIRYWKQEIERLLKQQGV
jgi:hypothetical protein